MISTQTEERTIVCGTKLQTKKYVPRFDSEAEPEDFFCILRVFHGIKTSTIFRVVHTLAPVPCGAMGIVTRRVLRGAMRTELSVVT